MTKILLGNDSISIYLSSNMGQPLPLPSRIPMPNEQQMVQFKEMDITIIADTESENFVEYELPSGWRMVDNREREDLPIFYIIDDANMKRVCIDGVWKGTYDNELKLHVLTGEQIELYMPSPIKKMTASETSDTNIVGNFAAAIDPLKRPFYSPQSVNRLDDYTGR